MRVALPSRVIPSGQFALISSFCTGSLHSNGPACKHQPRCEPESTVPPIFEFGCCRSYRDLSKRFPGAKCDRSAQLHKEYPIRPWCSSRPFVEKKQFSAPLRVPPRTKKKFSVFLRGQKQFSAAPPRIDRSIYHRNQAGDIPNRPAGVPFWRNARVRRLCPRSTCLPSFQSPHDSLTPGPYSPPPAVTRTLSQAGIRPRGKRQRLAALTRQLLEKYGRDVVPGHKGGEIQFSIAADTGVGEDSVRDRPVRAV